MRLANKLLLGFMGTVVPVIVAACYGVPYRYSKAGRVVDKGTGQGIPNLTLSCVHNGAPSDSTVSGTDGTFELWYDMPCDEVEVKDEDGADNGGDYGTITVPFCETCADGEWTIELEPAVP